ncbi:choice-of-anchor G family protein [uncultured Jatrophihabitans sp.]|uniref:choice-of-anchor G family protein n=1 Tax=uncultured Jatrophihabitans sp. TaxID=1610747 RepID=UPI0035CAB9A7
MTLIVESGREHPGRPRRRLVRLTALGVTVGVAAATIVGSGGGAAAAATAPKAQSVGRFLDGSAGGMAIESIADLVDARAKAAPNTSVRNPLEAKVLGQADVPIGNALQLPGGGALNLGAANQLANAKTDGSAMGASGALLNSGGASVGGDNAAYPADAKVNLSSALVGSVPIPALSTSSLPGLPSVPGLPAGSTTNLAALGGITADLGAVVAIAQTAKGGEATTPESGIADLKLAIGSPALGGLLAQLKALLSPSVLNTLLGSQANTGALATLLQSLTTAPVSIPGLPGLPSLPGLPDLPGTGGILSGTTGGLTGGTTGGTTGGLTGGTTGGLTGGTTGGSPTGVNCALTAPASATAPISLDDGAVVIDPTTATITIDVGKLVTVLLGKDISNLDTSNFDVIDFLVENLPNILSTGLEGVVTGITDSLNAQFTSCVSSLGTTLGVSTVTNGLTQLTSALQPGQTALINAINSATAPLVSASKAPLTQLAAGLKQILDIGLNVQSGPGIEPADTDYPYTSGLKATPDQATAVVAKQTVVRAIELDLLPASGGASPGGTLPGLPSVPGLGSLPGTSAASARQLAGTPRALAATGGAAVLALGNAAAGPSTNPTVPRESSSTPSSEVEATAIPTGIPAGAAGRDGGGSPALPIVLVLIGLVLAGGGVTAYRSRGQYSH